MSGITIQTKVHFHRGRRSRKELRTGDQRQSVPAGRVPRLSRLMALAIRVEDLVRQGILPDYAAAAQLGHITRARMTQITILLHLASDIQEAIVFLPPVERGRDPITERDVRPIVAVSDWRKQRRLWKAIIAR
jgi:hypothetical protein